MGRSLTRAFSGTEYLLGDVHARSLTLIHKAKSSTQFVSKLSPFRQVSDDGVESNALALHYSASNSELIVEPS
jgi:hypothetical protein